MFICLNTCSICNASSLEGTNIKICTLSVCSVKLCKAGSRKARVFPEPVGESNIRSLDGDASIAACCILFRLAIFRLSNIFFIIFLTNIFYKDNQKRHGVINKDMRILKERLTVMMQCTGLIKKSSKLILQIINIYG